MVLLAPFWVLGQAGETCNTVCQNANMVCDADMQSAVDTAAEMSAKFAAQLAAARTSAAEARIAQEGARERANRACARAEAIVGTGRLSTAVVAVRDCAAAAARTGDVGSPGFKADASLGAAPPR